MKQMKHGSYFMREQPAGTWIYRIEPWDKVVTRADVVAQCMDQCMTGAKDEYGDPVKKPTEWTTHSETLICNAE
eukprot:10846116-Lingulodinium_polyedra.AAC.1